MGDAKKGKLCIQDAFQFWPPEMLVADWALGERVRSPVSLEIKSLRAPGTLGLCIPCLSSALPRWTPCSNMCCLYKTVYITNYFCILGTSLKLLMFQFFSFGFIDSLRWKVSGKQSIIICWFCSVRNRWGVLSASQWEAGWVRGGVGPARPTLFRHLPHHAPFLPPINRNNPPYVLVSRMS